MLGLSQAHRGRATPGPSLCKALPVSLVPRATQLCGDLVRVEAGGEPLLGLRERALATARRKVGGQLSNFHDQGQGTMALAPPLPERPTHDVIHVS